MNVIQTTISTTTTTMKKEKKRERKIKTIKTNKKTIVADGGVNNYKFALGFFRFQSKKSPVKITNSAFR